MGRKIAIVFLSLIGMLGMLVAVPGVLWVINFGDLLAEQGCSFGSMSSVDYRHLLSGANAQRWTVWPGLSNGVFLPSDSDDVNNQLLAHIQELAGSTQSANRQLAAAHAIMRSIGAEYVQFQEVPEMHRNGARSRVYFTYFLPQIRFAPACLLCLVWWHTTIDIIFSHELATDRYELQSVNVLHAQLKYDPDKTRARNVAWEKCPELPTSIR